ncbi:MAG: c-type cytochrome biogenesis protein CcmI [Oleiphilus sp.]|nr:MAG: c-type cytochrome biogenesis protein CcmI [Oleiphilus sp.]
MTVFWLYSAALSLLAAAFLIVPLLRQSAVGTAAEAERRRQNIQIFKERLKELDAEQAAGRLDDLALAEIKLELEQTLLDDAGAGEIPKESTTLQAAKVSRLWLVLPVLLIGLSYGLYFEWGAFEAQKQVEAMRFAPDELSQAKEAANQGDMTSLVEQLHQKLMQAPDNIEGWTLLARSAMNIENYALASESYQRVVDSLVRHGEQPSAAYGLLAQAQYFRDAGMSEAANKSLEMALSLDPDELNALGLRAIHAFDKQDYALAAVLWQRLLEVAPEHPARASIEAGIMRAISLSKDANPDSQAQSLQEGKVVQQTTDQESRDDTASGPSIRVNVSLASELAGEVRPEDTVFIFARAETGPPMPLAASRHRVAELPLQVVLSDANAMSPMLKLSSAQRVSVVARISKSGQPAAQAGDLQGSTEGVELDGTVALSITIDETVQ